MINTLIPLTGQRVVFPFYHTVSDDKLPHIAPLYRVKTTTEFKADLEYLLRYYQPMDLNDLRAYLDNGKKRSKPGFFLTFDDGLREIYDVVRPILLQYGIPAAFFINPDFVDNKALFFRYKAGVLVDRLNQSFSDETIALEQYFQTNDVSRFLLDIRYQQRNQLDEAAKILGIDFNQYLDKVQPYMNIEVLKKLHLEGFYIGAHSMDHPLYSDISEADQILQTMQSLNFIQQNIQDEYRLFSFPFTEYGVSNSFFQKVDAAVLFGTAGLKNDMEPRVLHRIPMEIKDRSAAKILKNQYLYYATKSLIGKNIRRR